MNALIWVIVNKHIIHSTANGKNAHLLHFLLTLQTNPSNRTKNNNVSIELISIKSQLSDILLCLNNNKIIAGIVSALYSVHLQKL